MALTAELDRRANSERELAADRVRLAQLEREARERVAMLERQLAELGDEVRALRERLEAMSSILAKLDKRWLGRLARRAASDH